MTGSELFVPGRLCLFGEHTDWAGSYRTADPSVLPGLCMISGLEQGIRATATFSPGAFRLRQIDHLGKPGPLRSYSLDPDVLQREAGRGGFDSYAVGTAAQVLGKYPGLGLAVQVTDRSLPLKKGLSSSAAVCVLTARAFSRVHDLGLSVMEEMELAYRGELAAGSECGRMDQACAYGRTPVLLTLDGDLFEAEELSPSLYTDLLIVDLKASKNTRRILTSLNAAFSSGEPGIRRALGEENHRIVPAARSALEEGDPRRLGALMTEAQGIFDRMVAPLCPEELAAPVLHSVLEHPATLEHSWGGKGVGSQGDGTAQLVCRSREAGRILAGILERELGVTSLELRIG